MEKVTHSTTENFADGSSITTVITVEGPPEGIVQAAQKFYDQAEDTEKDEPEQAAENIVEFSYHGDVREVLNPQIIQGARKPGWRSGFNALLAGVELSKNGIYTGQYKQYRLDEIVALPDL